MRFTISNKLTVFDYTPSVLQWCNDNLVLRNPEFDKKHRMGLYLGNTPEFLHFYSKIGNALEIPFGCARGLIPWMRGNEINRDFADKPVSFERKNEVELYEYQLLASASLHMAGYGVLIAPTGSGKTITALYLAGEIGQRTLWLCHTRELLDQAKAAYERLYAVSPGDIGIVSEGKLEIGGKITFSLVQTLAKRIHDVPQDGFGCVICDEAQFCIKSLSAAAMFSKCVEHFKARWKYSVTATWHRADGQEARIAMLFGGVVHEIPRGVVSEKIMQPIVIPVSAPTPESFEYLNTDGTMNYTSLLGYLSENPERNKAIRDIAVGALCDRRSVLILCDRVNQAEAIKAALWPLSASETLDGTTDKKHRGETIEKMRSGECQCLISSTRLAGTGLDIPRLDCLIMASVQKDLTIVTQSIGRISRAIPGKPQPVCYDIVDTEIGYCVNAHKKRLGHYRRAGAVL